MVNKKKLNGLRRLSKKFYLEISFLMYRYEQYLDDAKKSGIRKSAVDGITNGFILLLIYCIFALGFFFL
jgi:hypothetical protein